MSTRNISWRLKAGRFVGLTTLPHSCAECLEIVEVSTSWDPWGLSRSVQGCFTTYIEKHTDIYEKGKVVRVLNYVSLHEGKQGSDGTLRLVS